MSKLLIQMVTTVLQLCVFAADKAEVDSGSCVGLQPQLGGIPSDASMVYGFALYPNPQPFCLHFLHALQVQLGCLISDICKESLGTALHLVGYAHAFQDVWLDSFGSKRDSTDEAWRTWKRLTSVPPRASLAAAPATLPAQCVPCPSASRASLLYANA